MAGAMFTTLLDVWNARNSPKYIRMEAQHEQRPGTNRSSFDESLEQIDSRRFTKWPNFDVEEDLRHGRPIRSAGGHSTAELFYTVQPPMQQSSSPGPRIKRMCTKFPWRDMSWMVGVSFAIGSAFFVANGFFLLLPLVAPSTNFSSELYWTGVTSLIGGVIFLIGGFAGVLEALNLNRGGQMTVTEGIAVDGEMSELEYKRDDQEALRRQHIAPFRDSANIFPLRQTLPRNTSPHSLAANSTTATLPALYGTSAFIFWPNTPHLRTTFFHDVLFIAAFIQSIGTFIFMVAIITSFPGVIDFTNIPLFYLSNLFPATLGGILFIIASTLQMIATQPTWYTPLPKKVDWHVGFWNVIGSVGFTLAGALPFLGTTEGSIQASAASLWGSAAFLLGGMLQWYCAMGNRP